MDWQAIAGYELAKAIARAAGVDPNGVYRIILDCCADGSAAKLYVETYASTEMLELDWSKGLHGAAIEILEADEAHIEEKEKLCETP